MDARVQPRVPAAEVPAVLVRMSEVAAGADDGFHGWYQRQHLAGPLAVDGIHAARRYRVAGGEPTYMTVYECRSIEVLASPASQSVLGTASMAPAPGQPPVRDTLQFACRETWSTGEGLGGSAIVVQCKPIQGREEAARAFIRARFGPGQVPALVRLALWEADSALHAAFAPPPLPMPAPRRGRGAAARAAAPPPPASLPAGPRWMLALESFDADRMALAVHDSLLGCESDKTGLLVGSWARYQLVCAHGAPLGR